MAKQPTKPAAPTSGPEPYPKTWAKMSKEARQQWMKVHRPNRPTGSVAHAVQVPPPPPPPQAPVAPQGAVGMAMPGGGQQPAAQGKQLVQIDVAAYTVRVGMREPVTCDPEDVIDTVDREMRAWEDQNMGEEEYEDDEPS